MLRLIFVLVANAVALVFLPLRWLRSRRAAPRGAWLQLTIDGAVVEIGRRHRFWERGPKPLSLASVRDALTLASQDPRVAGIVVAIESLTAGSATATSLRDTLDQARKGGKRVIAYLPYGGGSKELYVASVAERVLVGPDALVEPMGFAAGMPYFKDALERVGIEPEVMARGRYKTAGEPFSASEMSEAQREQLGAYLDTLFDALVDGLASGRRVDRAAAEAFVHGGPWIAADAVERGFCDAVIYPDELAKALAPDEDEGAPVVSLASYAARRRLELRPLRRPRSLAVIAVQGPIVSKPGAALVPMAVEEELVASLRDVWDDPRALGALVIVNSQGGGAIASDRIRRAVERLAAKKPVVAYLANVAASGGYMIAVGAPHIVAQPTTLTGSIGVIAARFGMEALLERVGVRVQVVKRGERADIGSPARRLTEGERGQLDRHLDETYRAFLAAVATGRNREVQDVEPLAGGRVWSGRDAHARGLVDTLGGLDVALAELRTRVGPRAKTAKPRIVTPRRLRLPMLLGRLPSALGPGFSAAAELAQLSLSARDHAWAWCEARELEAVSD